MNLTPMQLFTQKEIVKRAHHGLSFEEANAKESKIKGSILKTRDNNYREILYYDRDTQEYRDTKGDRFDSGNFGTGQGVVENTVIGLPPTLARVLNALGSEFYFWNGLWHAEKISNNYENRKYICDRKLLNEDGTDACLRDQSEETQNAIAVLLGWKQGT